MDSQGWLQCWKGRFREFFGTDTEQGCHEPSLLSTGKMLPLDLNLRFYRVSHIAEQTEERKGSI